MNWKRSFFTIWGGQAGSLIGTRVAQFALVWWLTTLTGSATVLTTASMVALLPNIVLGPFAGVYTDRWNRRSVMIIADGITALASLWLAYLFWMNAVQVWYIYVFMLVRAVGETIHSPAMRASTSLMVPQNHLTRVAGLNQTMKGALGIFGPPLGALLLALMPVYGIMLIDVGTAMLAILPLCFIHIPQPERKNGGRETSSMWTDMQAGFRYILSWPGLMVLIGVAMMLKIMLTPAFALLPLLVKEYFQRGAAELSLMQALLGIGITSGGFLLSVWGGFHQRIRTTITGFVGVGMSFLVLGFTPGQAFGMALISIGVIGFMIPIIDGPITALLQATVRPEMQGRFFSLLESLFCITSPVGLAIAGPVSDWLGLHIWYKTVGILFMTTGVILFFVPAIMNIEKKDQ